MNKRQVIILWAIAIGLGASVTAVKISQNKAVKTSTERKSGETLFSSFPATDAATVEIQGAAGSVVTLSKKDGKWVVVERGNYPANATFVNELIRTLSDLKITQAMEAGPSFAPRFGMDDSATKTEEHGLTATFKDASGKEIAKVGLGKNIENSSAPAAGMPPGMAGGGSVGRYVRNYADTSGFYAVGELFPSVSADAKHWLSDTFINPEKITSVTVYEPDSNDIEWKVSRPSEEAEFQLQDAKPGELADTTVTAPLKSLFSYARFEDVIPAEKVSELVYSESTRTVVINTAEGFSYKITLSALKAGTPAASKETPAVVPPAGNCLVTVEVSAELPKERKKEEGEKPEDAKAKDDAFAERHKALTEKLAKEQALAGVTFEVSASTVEALLKDRKTLTTKPVAPPEGADQGAGAVQQLPGGMIARPPVSATTPPIQAVTPPISVPAAEEELEQAEPSAPLPDGKIVEPYDGGGEDEDSEDGGTSGEE